MGIKTQQLPEPDWKVVIHDAHPAYLSWREYQQNQEQLKRNYGVIMAEGRIGSARSGSALLQGLVICGKCGRRMSPRYYGDSGQRASYDCNQLRKQNAQFGVCWTVAAGAIDEAGGCRSCPRSSHHRAARSFLSCFARVRSTGSGFGTSMAA